MRKRTGIRTVDTEARRKKAVQFRRSHAAMRGPELG